MDDRIKDNRVRRIITEDEEAECDEQEQKGNVNKNIRSKRG